MSGQWSPARRDFNAVAAVDTPQASKAIFEASSFLELLSAILFVDPSNPDSSAFRPKHSVKRVNIISHGSPGVIGMSGTVDTSGGVVLNLHAPGSDLLSGPIDVAAVQAAADPNKQLANGRPLASSLRERFAPDAAIYLLACRTGMAGSLLLMTELKQLFHVKIRGFSQPIAYCPQVTSTHITDRAFTAVAVCNSPKRGFHHLTPDRTF